MALNGLRSNSSGHFPQSTSASLQEQEKKEPMLTKIFKTKKLFTITCIFIYEERILIQNDDYRI